MKPGAGSLFALIGVVLIGMTGFGLFLPIFPFLSLELGATPTMTTLAMGAYSFGQLVAAPFWGRLSDRIGRKPVLITGLLGSFVSYLWIANAASIWDLGAARLFGGLMAGNIGAAFAAAADLADEKTRARNMGLLGAGVGFGFIAGPALGALIIAHEPTRADFAHVCQVSALLAACAALAALALFRETHSASVRSSASAPAPARWALLGSRPALARFVLIMLLMVTAQATMETTFGLWADARLHWGPRQVGWTLAALGLGGVLLQGGAAGRAARALGEPLTLMIGLVLFAAGLGGLAAAGEPAGMVAGLIALTLGIGLSTPALNALIAGQAMGDDRGAVMGLSQSAAALGRVAGPVIAGPAFEQVGPSAPFVAGALIILAGLFVVSDGAWRVAVGERRTSP